MEHTGWAGEEDCLTMHRRRVGGVKTVNNAPVRTYNGTRQYSRRCIVAVSSDSRRRIFCAMRLIPAVPGSGVARVWTQGGYRGMEVP